MLSFGFRIFCWYRGFCHRTGPDLFLFLFTTDGLVRNYGSNYDGKIKCFYYMNSMKMKTVIMRENTI